MINIIDKLWKYLTGYVIITIKGFNTTKLINKAVKNKIGFSNLNTDSVKTRTAVSYKDYQKLNELNALYKCSITTDREIGLNFIFKSIIKNHFFVLGMFVFVFILYFLSSRVWLIDISGNTKLTDSQIIEVCSQKGINTGININKIDLKNIAYELKNDLGNIAWINIRTKGSAVFIKLAEEQKLESNINTDTKPCDIVADTDCIITSIVTNAGQPLVKKGDTAVKGDVLVSGQLVQSGNEENPITRQVHSKAIIFGRVTRTKKFEIPLVLNQKIYTGKTYNTYSLKIFNKKFNMDFIDKTHFNSYDKSTTVKILNLGEGYNLPFTIYKTCYREYVINKTKISIKEAEKKAQSTVLNYIVSNYAAQSDILDCKVNYTKNKSSLQVNAVITSNEPVGKENYNIQILGGNLLNGST